MSESRWSTNRAEQGSPGFRMVDRRNFFRFALAGSAALMLTRSAIPVKAGRFRADNPGRWSDPRTWGGNVPGPRDAVVIASDVVLDTDARVAGVTIDRGGHLSFLGERSIRLESTRNVVVRGRLSMRPKSQSRVHRLVFTHVNESRFAGGGMKVLASDVGLWVMGHGVIDTSGTQKLAWTRAAAGIPRGSSTIELQEDPAGWGVGDRIALTPTSSPEASNFHAAFDDTTIAKITGRTLTLARSTRFDHPAVELKPGKTLTAEVLNLSRNVSIESTKHGRAHVFIHAHGRQWIENTLISHMGPRGPYQGRTAGIQGRYPLHFHECGRGSRHSEVKGTVVTTAGNHAFVPHKSDGINFVDCIGHDVTGDAFWWDPPHEKPIPASNDISWNRCVASLVRTDPQYKALRMSGFTLGSGDRNEIHNSVAVGVQGGEQSSGFFWRAPGEPHGPWGFDGNLAHNNESNGAFNWQNDRDIGVARRFIAYHNGAAGVYQGAYRNPYRFKHAILYGNLLAAIKLPAVSRHVPLRFSDSILDGAGLSDYAVVTDDHKIAAGVPTEFVRCAFRGYRHSAVWIASDRDGKGIPDLIDLVSCTFEGNEFYLHPEVAPATQVRVMDRRRGQLTARRFGSPGRPRPEWNASTTRGWRG
jgi:hypothetical protein